VIRLNVKVKSQQLLMKPITSPSNCQGLFFDLGIHLLWFCHCLRYKRLGLFKLELVEKSVLALPFQTLVLVEQSISTNCLLSAGILKGFVVFAKLSKKILNWLAIPRNRRISVVLEGDGIFAVPSLCPGRVEFRNHQ